MGQQSRPLIIKINRENLPRVKDRYPFIYLEFGRLEVDDSSIKWVSSTNEVIPIPVATISCILLGPGTSVTHEAVKVLSSVNCLLCWTGTDSLIFYAQGLSPVSDTRNMQKQISLSFNPKSRLKVVRTMYSQRFPNDDLSDKNLNQIMLMEGLRVKKCYKDFAEKYQVEWHGRRYIPGHYENSDMTNRLLTSFNNALYALVTSVVISLGYTPYVGFVHSGSPLPFVYDIADLYKKDISIDLAFKLSKQMSNNYDRHVLLEEFEKSAVERNLIELIVKDITRIMNIDSSNS
ncbi:MAG: type I-E CRISPR-associated endonuclease Cas1e [Ruminobacter sp.]|nr:type I-E CRISPR-associated endonuclease Cas1e [Ruminobacter sp.]